MHPATTLWQANHHNIGHFAFSCLVTNVPSLTLGQKLPEKDRNLILFALMFPALHKVKTHDKYLLVSECTLAWDQPNDEELKHFPLRVN